MRAQAASLTPGAEALERAKLREICEGFPCVRLRLDRSAFLTRQHRDACEWAKFRALFATEDAYVRVRLDGVPLTLAGVDDLVWRHSCR